MFLLQSLNVTDDGKKALMTLSKGDMRKVLNVLQSTSMAFEVVNEDNVYTCVGHPLRRDIERILETLLSSKSFEQAYDGNFVISIIENASSQHKLSLQYTLEIQSIKSVKGLALDDILTELHLFIMRCKFVFPTFVLNRKCI